MSSHRADLPTILGNNRRKIWQGPDLNSILYTHDRRSSRQLNLDRLLGEIRGLMSPAANLSLSASLRPLTSTFSCELSRQHSNPNILLPCPTSSKPTCASSDSTPPSACTSSHFRPISPSHHAISSMPAMPQAVACASTKNEECFPPRCTQNSHIPHTMQLFLLPYASCFVFLAECCPCLLWLSAIIPL